MGSLIGGILGIDAQESAAETQMSGQATQARIERQKRDFSRREFEKQLRRQQPFVDIGTQALPKLVEAVSNRADVSQLPATKIQGSIVSEFLGEQAPQFVKERALSGIEAIEAEKQKGRLSDLVNIGVGGVGTQTGTGIDLGGTLGRSFAQSGNIGATALQQSAINRANRQNQIIQGLAGLPSLVSTFRR